MSARIWSGNKFSLNFLKIILQSVSRTRNLPQFICGKKRPIKSLRLDLSKYDIRGDIERLDCEVCDNFIAMKTLDEEEGNYVILNIDEVVENEKKNFWHEAKTGKEKIVYYVLSQIVYPERDAPNFDKHESIYDFADKSDLVMLRWERGVAVGFYTLKPKGSKIFATNEEYAMPTLDTAYIRSEYRNQGMGVEILIDITNRFPEENVGFSRPISDGMWKVLEKFLTTEKAHRLKFWEIEEGGNEGSRKLVWFTLKKRKKKKEGI